MALQSTRKELPAQHVPAQLHGNLQPEPRSETSGAAHPEELMQRKLSGPHTITAQESIMLMYKNFVVTKRAKAEVAGLCPSIQ